MKLGHRILTSRPLRYVCVAVTTIMLWRVVSDMQTVEEAVVLPLVWDDVPADYTIQAPEEVRVVLAGKRRDIRAWLAQSVPCGDDAHGHAVHVSVGHLHAVHALKEGAGRRTLVIDKHALLLPRRITLVDYTPVSYRIFKT